MSEEVKRIQEVKLAKEQRDASYSTNLTGEQIFVRSCNTCHPSGRQGFGPSLENIARDFPTDDQLKTFIRQGRGSMPPQPKSQLTDPELDNLVRYLRAMKV
jgi:mono/diheme cytochrome c family protein